MHRLAVLLLLAALLLASSAAHAASIAFGLPIRPDSSPTIAISWSTSSECYFQDRNADGMLNQDDVCLNESAAGTTLSGLTDTDITAPVIGQYIYWNGSDWINAEIDLADVSRHTGLLPLASLQAIQDINVNITHSALNYTPASGTLEGHLAGIDAELATSGGGAPPGTPAAKNVGSTAPTPGITNEYIRVDARLQVDETQVQLRVNGTCTGTNAIQVVDEAGTVQCIDVTQGSGYTAVEGDTGSASKAGTENLGIKGGADISTTCTDGVTDDCLISADGTLARDTEVTAAIAAETHCDTDDCTLNIDTGDVVTQSSTNVCARFDGAGNLAAAGADCGVGGGGSPAGNDREIQINDAVGGDFGAVTGLTAAANGDVSIPGNLAVAGQIDIPAKNDVGGALMLKEALNAPGSAETLIIKVQDSPSGVGGGLEPSGPDTGGSFDAVNHVCEVHLSGRIPGDCVDVVGGGTDVQVNTGGNLAAADFQSSAQITFAEGAGVVVAALANGAVDLVHLDDTCGGPDQMVEWAAGGSATCVTKSYDHEVVAAAGNTGLAGSGQANDICNVFQIEADNVWEDCRQVENTGALTFGGGFVRRIRDSVGNITLDSCHAPHSDALGDGGTTNNAIRDFIANCTTYWLANSNNNVFGGPKFVFPDGSRYGLGTATANRITIPATATGYTWHGTPEFILTGSGTEDSDATTCTGTAGERTLTIPDGQCSTAGVETGDTLDIDHGTNQETQYVVQKCEPDGANPDIVTLHSPLNVTASATACTFYHNKIIVDLASGGTVHPGTTLRQAASLNPTAALGCDAADATCGTRTFPINFWVAQADRHDYAMDIVYGDSTANSTPHKDDLVVVRSGDDDSDVNFRFRGAIRYDVGIPNVNTASHPAVKYTATQRGIGCGVFIGGNAAEFDLPSSKATNGGYCAIRMGGRSGYSVIDLKNVGLENYLRPIVTGSRDLAVYNLGREYVGHHGVGTPPPVIEVQSTDAAQTGRVLRVTGGRVELGAGSRYVIGGTCDINTTSGCPELLMSVQNINSGSGAVDPASNFPVKVVKDTTQKHQPILTECAHNDNPEAKYHGTVWETYYPVEVIRLMCDVDDATGGPTVDIENGSAQDMFPTPLNCGTLQDDVCDSGDAPGGGDCATVSAPLAAATLAAGEAISLDVASVGNATRMSICWNYRYL